MSCSSPVPGLPSDTGTRTRTRFVILSGQAVLVDDHGRTLLGPGDIAAFPKGEPNAHCLVNESDEDCAFLVIGQSVNGPCHYPDVDMHENGAGNKRRKDGSAF